MQIQIQSAERDVLVQTIDEWLDGADDTERVIYQDGSIEEPELFLAVMFDHQHRLAMLRELKERLANAT